MSFSHIYAYTFSIKQLCIVCVYNSQFSNYRLQIIHDFNMDLVMSTCLLYATGSLLVCTNQCTLHTSSIKCYDVLMVVEHILSIQ